MNLEQRLTDKSWKERQSAYEDLLLEFQKGNFELESQLKSIICDGNQIALETGMKTVLEYIKQTPSVKMVSGLVSDLLEKCLVSSRAGTKATAMECGLGIIQKDKSLVPSIFDICLEALNHKTPKNVVAAISFLREIIKTFGVEHIKPVLKKLSFMFDHKDKNVRQEATLLAQTIYTLIGPALLPSLNDLKPVQLKELTASFETLGAAPKPTVEAVDVPESAPTTETVVQPVAAPVVDAYDFADPVQVLSKLPKSFYTDLTSAKWKERKDALDMLLGLVSFPKLEDDRYHELLGALAKRMSDVNIAVVIVAANCIEKMAKGLKKAFREYKSIVLSPVLERTKEKKSSVVDALGAALDAITSSVGFLEVVDEMMSGFVHKNPQTKQESILWFTRSKKTAKELNKVLKPCAESLVKALDDSSDAIRSAAAQGLGQMVQILGNQTMAVYLEKLDKVKLDRIHAKPSKPSKPVIAPAAEPVKQKLVKPTNPKPSPKVVKPKPAAPVQEEPIKFMFSDDSALDLILEKIPSLKDLSSSNWKTRLDVTQSLLDKANEFPPEAVIRALGKSWKESHFQVFGNIVSIYTVLVGNAEFNAGCASLIIGGLTERLGDSKTKKGCSDILLALKKYLPMVVSTMTGTLEAQKNPKLISEGISVLGEIIKTHGLKGVQTTALVQFIGKIMGNPNQAVRTNTQNLVTCITNVVGPDAAMLFSSIPSVASLVNNEINELAKAPPKTYGDVVERVDLTSILTQTTLTQLNDANWKERKLGLEELQKIVKNYKLLPSIPSEVIQSLKSRLSDSNKNLASLAVEIVGQLSVNVGKGFEKVVRILLPPMLAQLSDQKALVRSNVITNLCKISSVVSLPILLPMISTTMMQEQPVIRKELLKWLIDNAMSQLDECLFHPIFQCNLDKNPDVRSLAIKLLNECISRFSREVLKEKANDLYKGSTLMTLTNLMEPSGTVSTPVTKVAVEQTTTVESPKPKAKKTTKTVIASPAPVSNIPLLSMDKKGKEARALADRGLTKWAFDSPRKELIDFLSEQCLSQFSPELHGLLFSVSHYKEKDHLQGLTNLVQFIGDNQDALVANSDLIFKYLTLRFFDTNTVILHKCLELLEVMIDTLDNASYILLEYEASSFLPFFLSKMGDPKEVMRTKIKSILKKLTRVYPVSKLLVYLVKALESKNARTRSECLDEIAYMIQRNGATAFHSKYLNVLGTFIGDRDAGVRNAALNVITQAYALLNEDIYKYLKLSDKDKSLLLERLKRTTPATTTITPTVLEEKPRKPEKVTLAVKREFSLDLDNFMAKPTFEKPVEIMDMGVLIDDLIQQLGDQKGDTSDVIKQLERHLLNQFPPLIERLDAMVAMASLAMTQNLKSIVNLLIQVFSNESLARTISKDALNGCIQQVVNHLVICTDPTLSRALNVLMVRIIEKCCSTIVMSILLGLLRSSFTQNTKETELVMKCLWKLTKVIPKLVAQDLNVAIVLQEIEVFLTHCPPAEWKQKALLLPNADMPFKTVRTILYELCNVCPGLLDQTTGPQTRLILKALNERSKPSPAKIDLNEYLDKIFNMISDKDQTKQGIQSLYEFQQKHPTANPMIEDRLAQMGTYIQGYIRRSLSNLEMERQKEMSFGGLVTAQDSSSVSELKARLARMKASLS